MEKLVLLNDIFSCIRESRSYQNSLRELIIQVEQKIRWIKLSKRKLTQNYKPIKSRSKRKRVPYHSAYQLLNLLKTKIKRPNFSISPQFSPSEQSKLQDLNIKFPKDWLSISSAMQRPALDCFVSVQRSKQNSKIMDKKTWKPEEDEELCRVVQMIGTKNWAEVSNYINGKTGSNCMHRYMKTLNPDINRGKWEMQEDAKLILAVKLMGKNWVAASKIIGHRTDIQCRERYCNVLSPTIDSSCWDFYEDVKLVALCFLWGNKWSRIAKMYKGRTDNQCWRRSKYLVRTNKVIAKLVMCRLFGLRLPCCLMKYVELLKKFK